MPANDKKKDELTLDTTSPPPRATVWRSSSDHGHDAQRVRVRAPRVSHRVRQRSGDWRCRAVLDGRLGASRGVRDPPSAGLLAPRPTRLDPPRFRTLPLQTQLCASLRVALTPSRSSPPVAVALRVGPRPRRCGRHALGVGSARAVGCLRARLRLRPRPRRVERPSLRRARGAANVRVQRDRVEPDPGSESPPGDEQAPSTSKTNATRIDSGSSRRRGLKLSTPAEDEWRRVVVALNPDAFADAPRLDSPSSPWNRLAWRDVTGAGADVQLRDVVLESWSAIEPRDGSNPATDSTRVVSTTRRAKPRRRRRISRARPRAPRTIARVHGGGARRYPRRRRIESLDGCHYRHPAFVFAAVSARGSLERRRRGVSRVVVPLRRVSHRGVRRRRGRARRVSPRRRHARPTRSRAFETTTQTTGRGERVGAETDPRRGRGRDRDRDRDRGHERRVIILLRRRRSPGRRLGRRRFRLASSASARVEFTSHVWTDHARASRRTRALEVRIRRGDFIGGGGDGRRGAIQTNLRCRAGARRGERERSPGFGRIRQRRRRFRRRDARGFAARRGSPHPLPTHGRTPGRVGVVRIRRVLGVVRIRRVLGVLVVTTRAVPRAHP